MWEHFKKNSFAGWWLIWLVDKDVRLFENTAISLIRKVLSLGNAM